MVTERRKERMRRGKGRGEGRRGGRRKGKRREHKGREKRSVIVTVLEKAMASHSSTLAWKIPWTEEPGGLQSMGSHRVGHD